MIGDGIVTGQTFIPAGGTIGGVTAPPLSDREQAVRAASETFRKAWAVSLNLHTFYVRLYKSPREWNTLNLGTAYGAANGLHFADALPYWSKVENLTIHKKNINPVTPDPSMLPVSAIDIALSEGLIRRISHAMDSVPRVNPAFERSKASAAERAGATTIDLKKALIIKLVLREIVGELTGSLERDIRVVNRLAQVRGTYTDYLVARNPNDFVG